MKLGQKAAERATAQRHTAPLHCTWDEMHPAEQEAAEIALRWVCYA